MRQTPNGHPFVIEDRSVFDVDARAAPGDLRGGLGNGRPAVPRRLPRPAGRQGGQRHGRRLHQEQDPPDREGPGDGGEAGRHRPPLCRQAAADRHRLFRDLQPRQRRAGRRARRPDRGDHADRHPHAQRRRISARHHRLRHRLRRHDRPAAAHGHPRPRRTPAGRGLEGGPAQLPGPAGGGLSQPLHHHRPGQPIGAVQHAGGDRAARGLDHRLHRATCAPRGSSGSRRSRRRWSAG